MGGQYPDILFPFTKGRCFNAHDVQTIIKVWSKLTFFHVLTAEFVEHALVGPLSVIYHELRQISEFMMMILCDQAQQRGVGDVDYVFREGDLRKQVRRFVIETNADILVVGAPTRSPGRNIFSRAQIETFIAELKEEANIEVILVEPGEASQA